jgi:cobalt-zinc-cadmium resistance protein CzcA
MLNKIIAFSINNKLIIALLTLALIGFGIYETTKLPIDAVPDITDNQVQIITTSPSLGAPDVERFITFPIEQAISNIPGLKQIRSFSRFGLSVITIVFNDEIDIYWARQQVAERLQKIQQVIPNSLGVPEMAPITTGLGEIYQYILRPEKGYEDIYSTTDLRTIQDWIVRRQLLSVKGVADVASFGGKLKQYEVAVNTSKLAAHNISIQDVFEALENNNQNTGGAYIENGAQVQFIRSEGLVSSIKDIENIVIKNLNNGIPLLIKDVATVKIGHVIRYGAMTYNGEREVAGAVVMMLKGANSSEVIKNVKERINEIQKTLPKGVILEPFLDRTKMVNNAISTVLKNLTEGALIVIFVLVLFLGNLRAGFIVASVIPLSMLFAIIMMNLFGVSGNLMSLGALDFGLIVDGAVIIVESVLHHLTHSSLYKNKFLSQKEMDNEVRTSASKMMNSAVFGQIIILIVYLPILSLQGIEGKMFKPMAQTVAFALIGAFILSLTYVPMISSILISKNTEHKKNLSDKLMSHIENIYERMLLKALQYKSTILSSVIILFIISIVLLSKLGGEFIPTLPEGDFAVDTRLLQGSSLQTTIDAVLKSQQILLKKFPEIEKIVGKTGSSEIPTDPMPIEASDMMVILKPREEWTSAKTYDELAELMAKELENFPGVTYSFQYPVAMRFNELMTGARQDIVCKIFGENLDTLSYYANQIGNLINKLEGTQNIYVEPISGMPQIIIKINREAIANYGLKISDVNNAINTAFAGKITGAVYEDEKRFDLVVRLDEKNRNNIEDVKNLIIYSNGKMLNLNQVAVITLENSINQIQRENAHRRIIVGFNVKNRDIESTVKELQEKIESNIKLPSGYYIKYGGSFQNLKEAKERLSIAVPISLILIFILLYFAFNSIKYGLLIYTAIPLSAIGGILALTVRNMPFSISAGVGFIALFGVAVLNGIVLIAEFNRQKNIGIENLYQIVLNGGKVRLRPVLMTAFVASLGFLPMALSNGEGAEVQRPLATVVIGGLMLATFLTLFVLPILYIMFEKGIKAKNIIPSIILLVILLSNNHLSIAQEKIKLDNLIDIALKNNQQLRSEILQKEYKEKLKATAWNLGNTNINYEYGNINSSFNDNKFYVSQNVKFPTIYATQYKLLKTEAEASNYNLQLKENELKREVKKSFYELIYLIEKRKILINADSIYKNFEISAQLKFEKGESNLIEKSLAENQSGQISIQLNEIEKDIEVLIYKLKWLINDNKDYLPDYTTIKIVNTSFSDSARIENNPAVLYQQSLLKISKYRKKLEAQKLLPEIFLAYNDMSMIGTGADNIFYNDRTHRFRSMQVGVGIPIFFTAQKANITAEKINYTIAENNLKSEIQKFKTIYQQIKSNIYFLQNTIDYYEKIALINAEKIIKTANLQFKNGEINYIDWVLLINNALDIQSKYLENIRNYNDNMIELEFLLNY